MNSNKFAIGNISKGKLNHNLLLILVDQRYYKNNRFASKYNLHILNCNLSVYH